MTLESASAGGNSPYYQIYGNPIPSTPADEETSAGGGDYHYNDYDGNDNSEGDMTEQMLYTRLMHGYEKDVRPTRHHTLATNVTFGFLLQMVVDVDEKNQVLTSRSWLNINWLDHRLSWNESLYKGIRMLHIPHEKLWKPDIILSNNADPEYQESIVSTDIFVTPKGNVSWLASAIFRSSCQMRVRYYPFDDQARRLTNEFSCCPGKPWPVITIIIKLKRRPLFYVFNHILPCVLISSMAILGFYVPPDTGEKVTMCITTMLSMGVYLKTITEIIPPTSEAVPLIGVYYVVSLGVVCLATCVNVWTLNLHNRGLSNKAEGVSPWIRKWILGYLAGILFITIHQPDSPESLLNVNNNNNKSEDEIEALPSDPHSHRRLSSMFGGGSTGKGLGGLRSYRFGSSSNRTSSHHGGGSKRHTRTPKGSSLNRLFGYDYELDNLQPSSAAAAVAPSGRRSSSVKAGDGLRAVTGNSTQPAHHHQHQRHSLLQPKDYLPHHPTAISFLDDDDEQEQLPAQHSSMNSIGPTASVTAPPPIDKSPRIHWCVRDDGKSNLSAAATGGGQHSSKPRTNIGSSSFKFKTSIFKRDQHKTGPSSTNTNQKPSMSMTTASRQSFPSPKDVEDRNHILAAVKSEFESKFQKILRKVYKTINQNEIRQAVQEERARIMWEWKQLAEIVDRLLLWLFLIAIILTTFFILFEPAVFHDKSAKMASQWHV